MYSIVRLIVTENICNADPKQFPIFVLFDCKFNDILITCPNKPFVMLFKKNQLCCFHFYKVDVGFTTFFFPGPYVNINNLRKL